MTLDDWEGRGADAWRQEWGLTRFEAYTAIGSTNDRVRALARDGVAPVACVVADVQTGGRGRGGRRWASPPGGLWCSLLLGRGDEGTNTFPLVAGVLLAEAVEDETGVRAGLKWPNDLYVGERKLAGILCEEVRDAEIVVGVGVNVARPIGGWPEEIAHRAISLEEAGATVGGVRGRLLDRLIPVLRDRTGVGRFDADLMRRWSDRDVLEGRPVVCSEGISGIARGLSTEGHLRVETPDGIRTVRAGSARALPGPDRS